MTRLISTAAIVATLVGVPVDCGADTVFMEDNLVIHNRFDGNFDNVASGTGSAGVLGVAVPNGAGGNTLAAFVPSQPGGGQAICFPPIGWSDLAYHDAAVADVAGSTGVTFSMWFVHGQMPHGAPGWLFNAGSTRGNFGVRINTDRDELRASSPGGFFGGGFADKKRWHHIAYTIIREGGQFRAKFYIDGKLNDVSPQLFDKIEAVKSARIGSASYGGEWRLHNAKIDDFRLYNVGMTDGEIARLATEGGSPGTVAFSGPREALFKSIAPKQNNEKELRDRRKRAFIVYTRDYTTPCFANYVPTPKETEYRLGVEMAGNEYEPLQIGIYVPSGAGAVSDLRIEVDIDIPNEIGYLYYHTRSQVWRPIDQGRWYTNYPDGRRAMPRYLVPGSSIKRIEPGHSAGIWITFNTNDRVRAGVHRGAVVITRRGDQPQRLPLEVVVQPFALPRPKAVFGYYYRPDRIPRYWTRSYQEKYARHMAANGMNSGQISSFFSTFGGEAYRSDGRVPTPPTAGSWIEPWYSLLDEQEYADGKVDPVRLLEAQIEIFQEAGLIYPDVPIWGVQDNPLCENKTFVAETFRRMSIERGWPEVLFQTRDEPPTWSGEGAMQPGMVNAMLEWKRMKNARTFTALSMPSEMSWGHLHDIKIVMGGEITPEMLREAKRQGGQVFTYLERIRLTNVLINRYYSGLYTWGLGLEGNTPYCYSQYSAQPKAGQGATEPVWLPDKERISQPMINSYILPGPDGPIPGVGFEGRREGVDDYRYLQLLEARVAAARPTSAVAMEASGWLADLRGRIETAAIRGIFGTGYQYLWELDWIDPQPDIDPLEYRDIRQTAARYISQLPAAPGESNAPPSEAARQFPASGWEGEPFHDRSLDECLGALKKGSIADRRAAACALFFKDVDALNPGSLTAFIETLARLLEEPEVRIPAMRALRVFGPNAAPALEALKGQLNAVDPYVRCGALLAMESMGEIAIEGLMMGLDDPFPLNSVLAAYCLNRMGPDAAQAIPALKKAMASAVLRGKKQQFQGVIDSISRAAP